MLGTKNLFIVGDKGTTKSDRPSLDNRTKYRSTCDAATMTTTSRFDQFGQRSENIFEVFSGHTKMLGTNKGKLKMSRQGELSYLILQ